jgi:hypothetical protein
MIKQFAKLLILASALSVAGLPAVSVAKMASCTHEAKAKKLKGAEAKKFVHECLKMRKTAKKSAAKEKK